jgi:spore coat protein CotH
MDEFRIFVPANDINQLNSNLPESGREYKRAKLQWAGKEYDIDIKYRGDNYYHWLFEKKSYKLKLKNNKLIHNNNEVLLTRIKELPYFHEYLSNWLAHEMGLLAVKEKHVRVYLNNQYQGIYLQLEPIDKTFLELNKKALGTIWYGDIAKPEDNIQGLPNELFKTPYIWDTIEKDQNNDVYMFDLLQILRDLNTTNYQNFINLIDFSHFVQLAAWTDLVQTPHLDNNHNIVLFFDNTSGQFIQIPWDSGGFINLGVKLHINSNKLISSLYRNPKFVHAKNEIIWHNIENKQIINQAIEHITNLKNELNPTITIDPHKVPQNIERAQVFSMKGYNNIFSNFLTVIQNNNQLVEQLKESTVLYKQKPNHLTIFVGGNSAIGNIHINWQQPHCTMIAKKLLHNLELDETTFDQEILYPGLVEGEKFGNNIFFRQPAFISYEYTIDNKCSIKNITYKNLIDNQILTAQNINENQDVQTTNFSFHPWILEYEKQNQLDYKIDLTLDNNPNFILQDNFIIIPTGEHYINHDLIIPQNTHLTIQPGATLKLASGVSIVSYSPITAIGTKNQPIRIQALDKNQPFGVFALANEGASNSHFEYFEIEDGSEATINGIYFSGMFSAYHNNDITVKNSLIAKSHSDDGLNFKYSNSSIYNSVFDNNSADAIDFDFMSGEIKNNYFINNGNDSIDISGSTTLIANNHIKNSGDKCISVGEKSAPTIHNNMLENCNIGVESKDLSDPLVTNTVFYKNKTAINAYQKKDFFGPARMKVYNSLFVENDDNLSYKNTFANKKLKTDDSKVNIKSSLFDKIGKKEKIDPDANQKIDQNINIENTWSLSNPFDMQETKLNTNYYVREIIGLTDSQFLN